jgi:hypothetical protein
MLPSLPEARHFNQARENKAIAAFLDSIAPQVQHLAFDPNAYRTGDQFWTRENLEKFTALRDVNIVMDEWPGFSVASSGEEITLKYHDLNVPYMSKDYWMRWAIIGNPGGIRSRFKRACEDIEKEKSGWVRPKWQEVTIVHTPLKQADSGSDLQLSHVIVQLATRNTLLSG